MADKKDSSTVTVRVTTHPGAVELRRIARRIDRWIRYDEGEDVSVDDMEEARDTLLEIARSLDRSTRTQRPDGRQAPTDIAVAPLSLDMLELKFTAWHKRQWPDLTPELAERKFKAEIAEFLLAAEGWRWRNSPEALAAVLEEGADVLNTLLGVLRFFPGVGLGGAFAKAAEQKLERVLAREYSGVASRTRKAPVSPAVAPPDRARRLAMAIADRAESHGLSMEPRRFAFMEGAIRDFDGLDSDERGACERAAVAASPETAELLGIIERLSGESITADA